MYIHTEKGCVGSPLTFYLYDFDICVRAPIGYLNPIEVNRINETHFEKKSYSASNLHGFVCDEFSFESATYLQINSCVSVEWSDAEVIEIPLPTPNITTWYVRYVLFTTPDLTSFTETSLVMYGFKDDKCQVSFDEYYAVIRGGNFKEEKNVFRFGGCSQTHIIIDTFYGLEYLPRSDETKCLYREGLKYPVLLNSRYHIDRYSSIRLLCLSKEDIREDYLDEYLIQKSSNQYSQEIFSFNPSCSFEHPFAIMIPTTLDVCTTRVDLRSETNTSSIIRADSETGHYAEIRFVDMYCNPDFFSFFTVFYIHWDQCSAIMLNDQYKCLGLELPMYFSLSLPEDVSYPTNVAMVVSPYTCDEDITEHLADITRESTILWYFDSDFCVDRDFVDIPQIVGQGNISSFRGYCDSGVLRISVYELSYCLGRSERIARTEDFCVQKQFESIRIMCIPRFCAEISQDQKEVVCSGHGECVQTDICDCFHGYLGDDCDINTCDTIISTDDQNVCSGNGECIALDICTCNKGFSGEFCQTNELEIFTTIFASIFGPIAFIICCLSCLYLLICSICCFTVLFLSCLIGTGFIGISTRQRFRLHKFYKLNDFDHLLKEQILEKNESIAHLRINKSLFEVPFEEVKILATIGQGGSNAVVYLATWKGTKVAFKCFRTRQIFQDQDNFNQFESEVSVHAHLNHPNIVRFFGASLSPPRVGILMEYCENGDLPTFFKRYRERNNEEKYPIQSKLRLIREIICAMEYLHSRNIIHRDLKSENILVDESEHSKLMDFGISRIVKENESAVKTQKIGTSVYMSPEVLCGVYDEKVDCFSFAILLWVILMEIENPYGSISKYNVESRVANDQNLRPNLEVLKEVFEGEGEGEYFSWIKVVMKRCWSHDPTERFSFKDLAKIFASNGSFFVDEELYEEGKKN